MSIEQPEGPQTPLSILVVDDEAGFRNLLEWELVDQGMHVETAENGAQAIVLAKQKRFDVIISDITMPEVDGLKLLSELAVMVPQTPVILATGFGAIETAVFAMKRGAEDFILKPYDLHHLLASVKKAIERRSHCRSCGRPHHE